MPLVVVFRPIRLPKSGFLYGWDVSNNTICIAGALISSSREQAVHVLAQALSTHTASSDVKFPDRPQILGHIEQGSALVLDRTLQSVESWLFIEYCPPNTRRMQFFSLEPLELDITRQSSNLVSTTLIDRTRLLQAYAALIEPQGGPQTSLSISLQYLNKVYELRRIVTKRRNSHSVFLWMRSLNIYCKHLTSLIFNILNKTASRTFHSIPPLCSNPLRGSSAFVQQLDVRKDLLLFVLNQIWAIEKPETDDLHFTAVQYISLYNCIWLILNDIIIGTACGVYLNENRKFLSLLLYTAINKTIVAYIRNTLFWLDNWPAGLKLNTELSRALFHSFIQVTHMMEVILDHTAPYFPTLLQFAGLMGRFGLTMSLALFSDYLSILTGHLYVLHLVTALMFSQLKSFAGSLSNLFRGKRFNVLRKRNDSWTYDIDQLLLGTILITLVTFLFPTVLLYYVLFALLRFGIMILHAVLDTCLAFLNHFPLFALMLRIKEPFRLPGGVQFRIAGTFASLMIENQAIPLSKIFFQHLVVWSRLSSHYHPLRLLACILAGVPMTQLEHENIRYDLVNKKKYL